MRVGFTGTRKGLTKEQSLELRYCLERLFVDEFHHGDCVGADAEAHNIVRELFPKCLIVKHPPLDSRFQAFCDADEEREALEYLARNHKIVQETDILVACPDTEVERRRSGTWSTCRFARNIARRITYVFPGGGISKMLTPGKAE